MTKSDIKLLAAAAAGLAAGIGIGILIAPAKGSKTRKRLKRKFFHLADLAKEELNDQMDAFKSAFISHEEEPGKEVIDEEVIDQKKDENTEGEAK